MHVPVCVQGQVLVAGASNIQATAEDCCQACWMYGGQPHNFTDAKMGEWAHPLWRVCGQRGILASVHFEAFGD